MGRVRVMVLSGPSPNSGKRGRADDGAEMAGACLRSSPQDIAAVDRRKLSQDLAWFEEPVVAAA